ncbi:alpha/beta-gliadin clone PW1215-like [Drosophila elegans]|uniref:alpha/beta-gliadin clone PW1215-like n=1 Tax=Drosophila elegans TaxID=30023 RepID=UPI001BC83BCA|nr:alpha/beta-gliadin clone PW1215-like [Drosophila elegans]
MGENVRKVSSLGGELWRILRDKVNFEDSTTEPQMNPYGQPHYPVYPGYPAYTQYLPYPQQPPPYAVSVAYHQPPQPHPQPQPHFPAPLPPPPPQGGGLQQGSQSRRRRRSHAAIRKAKEAKFKTAIVDAVKEALKGDNLMSEPMEKLAI